MQSQNQIKRKSMEEKVRGDRVPVFHLHVVEVVLHVARIVTVILFLKMATVKQDVVRRIIHHLNNLMRQTIAKISIESKIKN